MDMKKSLLALFIGITSIGLAQQQEINWTSYNLTSKSGETLQTDKGSIIVPENRKTEKSRNIELHFIRLKSTNPNPSFPIIYLAGGPGGSGIKTAQGNRFELFKAMREVGDVIVLDQRGTGLSNQIPNCDRRALIPIDQPGTKELYISKMSEAAAECLAYWKEQGVDMTGYNTIENAEDIEDIRRALGVDKLNLWGISYGSHLAFTYIKLYENNVNKLVLAGLEGPDQTIKLPIHNQHFLERVNTKIQNDEGARKVYPDLLELMNKVLTKLENEPQTIVINEPRSGKQIEVGISKLDVQLVTTYFLTKNPENSIKLPIMYYMMDKGQFEQMAQMVYMLKSYAGMIQGMPLMMDGMSGVSPDRWKKVLDQENKCLLGRTTNFPYPDLAQELDLPNLGDSFWANPKSDIDALFFSGTLDGRTYLEAANELTKGFKNASHITLDGAGHDLFMSTPKVKELMIQFFQGSEIESQTLQVATPNFILPN